MINVTFLMRGILGWKSSTKGSLQRLHASPIQGQYRMRGLHPGALFATFMASEQ